MLVGLWKTAAVESAVPGVLRTSSVLCFAKKLFILEEFLGSVPAPLQWEAEGRGGQQ